MKSNKGITLTGLVLYVLSFLMICGMIAVITTFFYNNEKVMSDEATDSVEWDIFNAYMLKECSKKENIVRIVTTPQTVSFYFSNKNTPRKPETIINYFPTTYKGITLKKYNNNVLEKSFALTKPSIENKSRIRILVYADDSKLPVAGINNVIPKEKFTVNLKLNGTEYKQTYYVSK